MRTLTIGLLVLIVTVFATVATPSISTLANAQPVEALVKSNAHSGSAFLETTNVQELQVDSFYVIPDKKKHEQNVYLFFIAILVILVSALIGAHRQLPQH
jgi:hypothetical protein